MSAPTSRPVDEMRFAHVLFMDIIAYSRMPTDQQVTAIRTLTEIVRNTAQYQISSAANDATPVPTGDGMALAFFRSPEEPLRCAIEVTTELQKRGGPNVRIGIHSGPVYLTRDVTGAPNVAGDGMNMAQRVMDCGDGGHVLASGTFASILLHHSQWSACLHLLGEVAVKHGERVRIYNCYSEEFGNSALPGKVASARNQPLASELPAAVSAPWDRALEPRRIERGWFFRQTDGGGGVFIVFANARGSCSMRCYDAHSGQALQRLPNRGGDFRTAFREYLKDAIALRVSRNPNLEQECKQALPAELLLELRQQLKLPASEVGIRAHEAGDTLAYLQHTGGISVSGLHAVSGVVGEGDVVVFVYGKSAVANKGSFLALITGVEKRQSETAYSVQYAYPPIESRGKKLRRRAENNSIVCTAAGVWTDVTYRVPAPIEAAYVASSSMAAEFRLWSQTAATQNLPAPRYGPVKMTGE